LYSQSAKKMAAKVVSRPSDLAENIF